MAVFELLDNNELREVPARNDPEAKKITFSEKPWCIVVWTESLAFISVYGPYSSQEDAQKAASSIIIFLDYRIIQMEDL